MRGEKGRLAALLGISQSQLSMILHGGRACSPAEAAHIEAVTEGQITRMELLYRHESTNPLLPEI